MRTRIETAYRSSTVEEINLLHSHDAMPWRRAHSSPASRQRSLAHFERPSASRFDGAVCAHTSTSGPAASSAGNGLPVCSGTSGERRLTTRYP